MQTVRRNWSGVRGRNQIRYARRQLYRRRMLEYLWQHPCVDCWERDPVVLEFDHRGGKQETVSNMLLNYCDWARIQHELSKCDVRCANCHRRRTAKMLGWYRAR